MNKNRKKILTSLVGIIAISMLVYGTAAFFNESLNVSNSVTTDGVKIALHENFDGQEYTFDGQDSASNIVTCSSKVLPGSDVEKVISIENKGSDAYVRIKIEKVITLADGTIVLDSPFVKTGYGEGASEYNSDAWILSDGWYYYTEPMEKGETEPVISSIVFDKAMPNEYQGCRVEVKITAEATQVSNNGDNAANAKGWPDSGSEASGGGAE